MASSPANRKTRTIVAVSALGVIVAGVVVLLAVNPGEPSPARPAGDAPANVADAAHVAAPLPEAPATVEAAIDRALVDAAAGERVAVVTAVPHRIAVVDAHDAPIASARVFANASPHEAPANSDAPAPPASTRPVLLGATNGSGEVDVLLPPRAASITCVADGFATRTVPLARPLPERTVVRLVRGATIAGVVLDGSRAAAPDVRVVFWPEHDPPPNLRELADIDADPTRLVAVSDAAGRFRCDAVEPGAWYRYAFGGKGCGVPYTRSLVLRAPELDLRITVDHLYCAAIALVDDAGAPVGLARTEGLAFPIGPGGLPARPFASLDASAVLAGLHPSLAEASERGVADALRWPVGFASRNHRGPQMEMNLTIQETIEFRAHSQLLALPHLENGPREYVVALQRKRPDLDLSATGRVIVTIGTRTSPAWTPTGIVQLEPAERPARRKWLHLGGGERHATGTAFCGPYTVKFTAGPYVFPTRDQPPIPLVVEEGRTAHVVLDANWKCGGIRLVSASGEPLHGLHHLALGDPAASGRSGVHYNLALGGPDYEARGLVCGRYALRTSFGSDPGGSAGAVGATGAKEQDIAIEPGRFTEIVVPGAD